MRSRLAATSSARRSPRRRRSPARSKNASTACRRASGISRARASRRIGVHWRSMCSRPIASRSPARSRIDASLRFESADASTHGAAQGIRWRSLLPGIYMNWDLGTEWQLRLLTGVSRAADQVKLGLLAYGDPAAPTADIYRWNGGPLSGAPLVGRVGPGTGGDAEFVTIDPELRRPMMDQFAFGIEGRPVPKLKVNILGLARRQSPQIHGVNIGVPISGYTTFTIPDVDADLDRIRRRSAVDHLQPAPGDVRVRSIPAHQSRSRCPRRWRRWSCRESSRQSTSTSGWPARACCRAGRPAIADSPPSKTTWR